jgi:hypothetical protein
MFLLVPINRIGSWSSDRILEKMPVLFGQIYKHKLNLLHWSSNNKSQCDSFWQGMYLFLNGFLKPNVIEKGRKIKVFQIVG